jgi:uncharacterized membrane protein
MKRIFTHPIFWIFIVSFLPVIALLVSGLPVTHDGQDHVARIANFYQSLLDGNIVPRWAGNLNWGYGHPILMFLYPLPSYLASLFHFVGFSFVSSTKLVFGVAFIASALTMYVWMNSAFGKKAGVIGALLYTFAPYRFVDLYVRGALGEHVAFVFPPLVLYFLYKMVKTETGNYAFTRNFIGASVAIASLILAHNAIAIMFIPIIILYIAYLAMCEIKRKSSFRVASVCSLLAGFGLSAFFWIPAFFEGKYTLREIVTAGEALKRFVPWSWFVYSPWNYGVTDTLTKSLGFTHWLGVIMALFIIWKTKRKNTKILFAGLFVVLLVSFFIMTSSSLFIWTRISLLQNFQFPWRFLSVSVFTAAVLGGISINNVIGSHHNILFLVCCMLLVISTFYMWHPKAYEVKPESFYSGIYPSTTDTGESSPIWSVRFMEHPPKHPLEVIDGNVIITASKRTTTTHEYSVIVKTQTRMLENTLYFPGWKIYIDDRETPVEFQDIGFRGLMTFYVTPGAHTVRVVFEDTKLRQTANVISGITLVTLVGFVVGETIWKRKK